MSATDEVRTYYDADPEREWLRTQQSPYHQLEFDIVQRLVLADALLPASSILDIGSGPGRHALALAARGHRLALADISLSSLELATQRFRDAGLTGQLLGTHHVDAAELVVRPGSFDAVILFGPIYHLLDDAAAHECVRRAASALRPGGQLFAIFLTRTSVVRDLLKRGRFGEIRSLLAQGYLDHGRYRPLSPESRVDYMPPARTHRLSEAIRLLTAAGLTVTHEYSLEGAAAWMRPYIDQVAGEPAAFAELSEVIRATATLPELVEAGDHFLLRAALPEQPR